jgi:hypothetical protein
MSALASPRHSPHLSTPSLLEQKRLLFFGFEKQYIGRRAYSDSIRMNRSSRVGGSKEELLGGTPAPAKKRGGGIPTPPSSPVEK